MSDQECKVLAFFLTWRTDPLYAQI